MSFWRPSGWEDDEKNITYTPPKFTASEDELKILFLHAAVTYHNVVHGENKNIRDCDIQCCATAVKVFDGEDLDTWERETTESIRTLLPKWYNK